jgi:threonine dehydratase
MLELADILAARKRLEGAIYATPCAYSKTLSELAGVSAYVKLENLQMTGSFKERGAANLLLQLDARERARGVAAASAWQSRPGRRVSRRAPGHRGPSS